MSQHYHLPIISTKTKHSIERKLLTSAFYVVNVEYLLNNELTKMSEEELQCWLKAKLGSKWSERDFIILAEVIFKEYQSMNSLNKQIRTDREFFAKMLIKGKISKGISLED